MNTEDIRKTWKVFAREMSFVPVEEEDVIADWWIASLLAMLPPEMEWQPGYPKAGEFCLADGWNYYRQELLAKLKQI